MLRPFCVMAVLAAATACTEPVSCTLEARQAFTVSVRAPGGAADLSEGSQLDVTQDGIALPPSAVQHIVTGPVSTAPIVVYGSGGVYRITVHHANYRDTTVTANVATGECGPPYPPAALTIVLTAL